MSQKRIYREVNGEYCEWIDGQWRRVRKPKQSFKKRVAVESIAGVGGTAAEHVLLHYGVGRQVSAGGKTFKTANVSVDEVAGLEILPAGVGAGALNASASATATPVGASASAAASLAEANAHAGLLEGVLEVEAEASTLKASAHAGAGVAQLGALAGAEASVVKVGVGITNTPLQAHASAIGAGAEAGVSWKYTGASAGAHLGEVQAGPFGLRAGLKIGAGIRNGVPEVDAGPVTAPCCVM